MASQVAERYGQALFELAKESGELVRWGQQARGLAAVVEENPQLLDFFNAVKISAEEKKQMVNTLFAGQVDNMLVHFLDLLIDKKRTKHTVEILRQFISLENAERGVAEGVVYSARKLAKEDVARIAALIRRVSANRSILMVEHNLSVVADLSDTITVLARGAVLAQGDYATVSRDERVITAYMGSEEGEG